MWHIGVLPAELSYDVSLDSRPIINWPGIEVIEPSL